jgi:hypothetical protein
MKKQRFTSIVPAMLLQGIGSVMQGAGSQHPPQQPQPNPLGDIIWCRRRKRKCQRQIQSLAFFCIPFNYSIIGQTCLAESRRRAPRAPYLDHFNITTAKILALTPEQLNSEAKQAIEPDRLVRVIVGDMSKVEAGIRELNLGEVRKIDVNGNPLK